MPQFAFNSRYVLLTYPQSDGLDPFDIVNLLSSLGAECIVGREAHSDGGTHYHAFVDFGRKFRSRRTDIFDIGRFHPNVTPSRGNPRGGYDYATKDGEIVAGGLEPPPIQETDSQDSVYADICMAPDRDTFWNILHDRAPKLLLSNFNSLSAYAEWRYRVDPKPFVPNPDYHFDVTQYPQLDDWSRTFVDWDASVSGRGKSLVLYGPTRTGKTEWARHLGNHAYFGGLFSLEEDLSSAKYAIFDDICGGISFFPQYKSWLGMQLEFYCTDKYKKKKLVKWGKPCIWLSNEDPRMDPKADIEWLEGNCIFVNVTTPLF
uniref:Replication-associated protein n=1 Tax=Genomoviridae sp. TaxID=2202565 RepID=A0A8F5MM33_9VIRU|nr:MAG: replication associated protein [Genomoviridae sp.]